MKFLKNIILIFKMAFPNIAIAGSFSSITFGPDDPKAILMAEESAGLQNGKFLFERVDLEKMKRFEYEEVIISKQIFDGRLQTKYRDLQTTGEHWMISGYSRFSATRQPAGDYVFSRQTWDNGSQCLKLAAPVFRFRLGVANLIPLGAIPPGGYAVGLPITGRLFYESHNLRLRRDGGGNSLEDAQRVLDERQGIKAKVQYAELLGYVTWRNKKGKYSACKRSGQMIWFTEENAADITANLDE